MKGEKIMIKKSIYPKTERISERGDLIYLTEKMDGSNLVFFKKMENYGSPKEKL